LLYIFSRRKYNAYVLEDNIPDEVKQKRVEEIMEIQQQISWEKNQEKVGKIFKCIFDRKKVIIS
jgi:ribosomal protein S12 methylthiotransferase